MRLARRDWAGARIEFELALAALTAAGHGDRAFAEHNLGLVAAATGKHAEALEHYARAGAIYSATIGDEAMAPTRLDLDRARSLAHSDLAAARLLARHAIDAATLAKIPWIGEDAKAFLDGNSAVGPRTLDASVEPPAGPRRRPNTPPVRTEVPDPPRPLDVQNKPTPRRDVGTYGASQNF